jgi:hypothetical protein
MYYPRILVRRSTLCAHIVISVRFGSMFPLLRADTVVGLAGDGSTDVAMFSALASAFMFKRDVRAAEG